MVKERSPGPEQSPHTPFARPDSEGEVSKIPASNVADGANLEWQKGYRQLQLIHQLTLAVVQADQLETIYEEALRGLQEVVGANRAAVLRFDEAGVMQFVAWRGLSDGYRQAAAGHSPWTPDTADPQPVLVSNIAEEASLAALANQIIGEGIHALGFIPLLYQGRLMGKFMLYYDQPHVFTVEEVQLAQTIAGHVAFAIARQQTTQALQEANDRLEQRVAARTAELRQRNEALQIEIARRENVEKALHQESRFLRLMQLIAAAANSARTVDEAFQFALDQICEYTGWPVGHVYIWEESQRELAPSPIWHLSENGRFEAFRQVTARTRLRPDVGLPGRVYSSGKPAWIPDVHQDDNFPRAQASAAMTVRAGFAFPVLVGNQVTAVLEFFSPQVREPDEYLLQVMTYVGAQLGRVVERKEVEAILRQNEEQYRTLARNIPKAAVFLFDQELRLKLVEGDEKIHPSFYKGAEGKTIWELMPPEEYPTRGRYYQEALQGKSHVYERAINGHTLQVYVLPIQNEQGEITSVMTMAQDITEHKEAQANLARNAEQLRTLNEVGQVIASSLDLNVVFSRVLDSLRRLLDAEGVFILLHEAGELVFVATDEDDPGRMLGRRLSLDEYSVSVEVFKSGRPLWIKGEALRQHVASNSVAQESGYFPEAMLAVPLKLQGAPIGVMAASHRQEDAFDDADCQLLEAVAAWTAIAIGNARQHQALQRRLRERETLALINQALSETLDMDLVLRLIAVAAQQIIPNVDWAIIHLLDDKKQLLYPAAVAGLELPAGEYILHPGEGIGGRAIEEGRVFNVADVQQDPRRAAVHERLGLRALLVCPVQSRTRRLGTITIHRGSAERFSAEDEQLLGTLGNQVAMAIENARLFKQVEAGRERLRQLTQKVISAQEEERRRISYDLHDEAGQALTAVKINLSLLAAEVPDAQETLRRDLLEIRDLVSETMEQIRLLAHDLRPPIVDSFSLNLALENMCKEFAQRTNYQATYRGEELPKPLSDEVTISFYRFVKEALTNVMKHAQATQVEVVLRLEDDRVVVSVADNGRGFDYEEGNAWQDRSGGIGLAGMRERFDLLGGQLEINSVTGKGTTITAYAPYQIGKAHD